MAGVSATSTSDLECPVCHEDYTQPKILPCNHRVCRHCVVSWLRKGGRQVGCPLCRVSILPRTRSGQGDLGFLVDALPTDLAIVAHVNSHKILTSRHICTVCENNVAAKSFCFQCDSKLCKACAKGHRKLPSLKNHVIEELNKLTPQRLAKINRSTCKKHDDKLAELYCSAHQELICMGCFPTNHRSCPEVKAIADVAKEKRTELKQQAQRLKQKEPALVKQVGLATAADFYGYVELKQLLEVSGSYDSIKGSIRNSELVRYQLDLYVLSTAQAHIWTQQQNRGVRCRARK